MPQHGTPSKDHAAPTPMSREWHWHPDLPVGHAPYWHWPPRPRVLLRWLWQNYLQVSDRSMFLGLALLVGLWIQPATPSHAEISFDWAL